MSATFVEARPIDSDWLGWLKRELAPTSARKIRTAIIVAGAVLCVIISMALQVPQLATSAYMVFFISKESKLLTTNTGVGGVIVLTIGIGATLLLTSSRMVIRNCAFSEWQSRCFSECGCRAFL